MSPKIIVSYAKIHPKSVGTFEKRPQISINCSGLFMSLLIAVLPWKECLAFIYQLYD